MRLFILFILLFLLPYKISAETLVTNDKMYTPKVLTKHVKLLSTMYPEQIETKVIGYSTFKQPIWAIRIGKGEKNILIHAAHHGREWITSMIVMRMVEEYAEAYQQKQLYHGYNLSLLDDVSIWFVPMVNPDGVEIQQNGLSQTINPNLDQLIMMNGGSVDFSRWKANGIGIDLNRQYPAGWDQLSGSAPFPFYQLYKGKEPLVAPEVKAIERFTHEINPSIAAAYHSSGRVVYWYYKTKMEHVMRDWTIAKKITDVTNYELDMPVDTATGGGYTDWFIHNFQRPAVTIEVGYEVNETSPPLSVFQEEWERNQTIGLLLVQEAKKLRYERE
ncbi:M14 family metallopeptidase [Bacillus pinisoli]|uniref:M14 family metallopeptidase n=1 Tax=Bacillus pinisoli TaxID=2901866 RepID=UPI001FF209D8|nr:M14 family metallocarboxypeptidase [Bacillus pinisoli]